MQNINPYIWAPELNNINSVQRIPEDEASIEEIRASIGVGIEVCPITLKIRRYRIVPIGIA